MKLSAKLKSPKSPKSLRVLISNCGLLPLTSASLCPQKSWSVPAPISQTSTCDAMELCGERFLHATNITKGFEIPQSPSSICMKSTCQSTSAWYNKQGCEPYPSLGEESCLRFCRQSRRCLEGQCVAWRNCSQGDLDANWHLNLKCINYWHSQVSTAGACLTATSGAYRVGEGCRAEDGQAAIAQRKTEEMMKSSSTYNWC